MNRNRSDECGEKIHFLREAGAKESVHRRPLSCLGELASCAKELLQEELYLQVWQDSVTCEVPRTTRHQARRCVQPTSFVPTQAGLPSCSQGYLQDLTD